MFQRPACQTVVSRLILLHVRGHNRLVTMSTNSDGNRKGPTSRGLRGDAVMRSAGGEEEAGRKFTEEEMKIYRVHRDACEAEQQMYVDPSSGYKVFTEAAHRRRGSCCGTACRHCPYGQVNVKDPARRKRHNTLFYVEA